MTRRTTNDHARRVMRSLAAADRAVLRMQRTDSAAAKSRRRASICRRCRT